MLKRLTVRNIIPEVLDTLAELASLSERSVEGEARYALKIWAKSKGGTIAEMNREQIIQSDISERLMFSLNQRKLVSNIEIKTSHIAEELGYEKASVVDQWFHSEVEPSFEALTQLAHYFSVDPKWLKHGDYEPFTTEYIRLPLTINDAVKWFLKDEIYDGLKEIAFVRLENGALYIVKIFENYKVLVFTTPYYLSNDVGDTGRRDQIKLSKLFKELYKEYTSLTKAFIPLELSIKSYVLNEVESKDLQNGQMHPLAILSKRTSEASWWEDLWEKDRINQREYWPDYYDFCNGIDERTSD